MEIIVALLAGGWPIIGLAVFALYGAVRLYLRLTDTPPQPPQNYEQRKPVDLPKPPVARYNPRTHPRTKPRYKKPS